MQEDVSTFRLYLMRGLYLLITLGLGSMIWPLMFHHKPWDVMHSVAMSLLAALSALMALGIRYPLRMLPLLLFEFLWKTIWLVAIGLPLWRANQLDPEAMETFKAVLMGVVICPLVIPWGFVLRNYVLKRGERWGRLPRAAETARS
jgi:hypothetical protein